MNTFFEAIEAHKLTAAILATLLFLICCIRLNIHINDNE